MADMITLLEVEDSIANYAKVHDRVREVALFVGEAHRKFEGLSPTQWDVQSFGFNLHPRNEMEPFVHVTLSINWTDRPITRKYGDPQDDDEDEDEYHSSDNQLLRSITFPIRYLTTTGWEAEEEIKAKKQALGNLQLGLSYMEYSIKAAEQELKKKRKLLSESQASIENLKRELGE